MKATHVFDCFSCSGVLKVFYECLLMDFWRLQQEHSVVLDLLLIIWRVVRQGLINSRVFPSAVQAWWASRLYLFIYFSKAQKM